MATKKLFAQPDGVTREYTRDLLAYAKELEQIADETVIADLPALVAQYEQDMRVDNFATDLERTMQGFKVQSQPAQYVATAKLPKTYAQLDKFNKKEFRMVVKANTGKELPAGATPLGIDVYGTDVNKSLALQVQKELWLTDNAKYINDMRSTYGDEIEGIIRRGTQNGLSVKQLTAQIRAKDNRDTPNGKESANHKLDYRAKLIAQDQINKGNAALTRVRLKSVGVKEYIWRSVQDSRVRPDHVIYNGNQYPFDNPPPEGNPGEPVRCRCRAEAVWPDEEQEVTGSASSLTELQKNAVHAQQKAFELGGSPAAAIPGMTNKSLIWGEGDRAWAEIQNTTDITQVLAMRKRLMASLVERYSIPRTTLSVTLGDWQKARLGGAIPAKAIIPKIKLPPPTPPVLPAGELDLSPAPTLKLENGHWGSDARAWHHAAFADAPAPVKRFVMHGASSPNVRTSNERKAYMSYFEDEIYMGNYKADGTGLDRAVWRHEFGHYKDAYHGEFSLPEGGPVGARVPRVPASNLPYYSSDAFTKAIVKDKDKLIAGDRVMMQAAKVERDEYSHFATLEMGESDKYLSAMYKDLGLDVTKVKKMYAIHGSVTPDQRRLFGLGKALKRGNSEEAIKLLTGFDTSGAYRDIAYEKGAFGMLSDLIGAITKEQLGGYRTGFGHGKLYYKTAAMQETETFANLMSLYGSESAETFDAMLKHLTPNVRDEFRIVLKRFN